MKKILNFCLLALSFVLITSCDSGFDTLNTSKVAPTTLDPAFVLNNAVINSSPGGSAASATSVLSYDLAFVQQVISSGSGVIAGGNWNTKNIGNTPLTWISYYQNVVKYTNDVIIRTKDDPKRANLLQMARIVQANAFMILTDTYGDIPYTEAGGGFTALIFFPKYETQQTIYPKIIQELTDASGLLSTSNPIETSDVLFGGNVAKWKKFGYSLLLRAGMRLSKANAALAQTTVNAAVTGGVILTNADNAAINHDGNFNNSIGGTVTGTEYATYYLSKPFVDLLKNSSDPRLTSIAIRYVGAASGADQNTAINTPSATLFTDKTAANQYGMPVGSDDNSANISGATLPGGGKQWAYSQMDRNRFITKSTPMFLVTAGQTNLLLAEAAFKGWVPGGFAQATTYYNAGITAHMNQMASYSPNSAISGAAITSYLAIPGNQLTPGTELQQIGYQYWIASFLHGSEAWANFRRTGFPALTPNPYKGDIPAGTFAGRISYPPSELLVNGTNINAAIAIMGPDLLSTQVWWAK